MASIFDNPNFQLMEKVAGKPAISVTPNGVGFSKQVLSRLSYAHYVLIYIDKIGKKLAIKACNEQTPGAIKFIPEGKDKANSLRWNNPSFKEDIKNLVSKELAISNFICYGEFINEDAALLFDFTKACPSKK